MVPRLPLAASLALSIVLSLLLALLMAAAVGCQRAQTPADPADPADPAKAGPVVWRLAPAPEGQAPKRVAQHLLAMEALSGPLITLAMRDDGRALCQRWGEEVGAFIAFTEPDFLSAAQAKPLKAADQAAIEAAYQQFGAVAARCMAGGEQARATLTRVKDLVKPMLRAI